MKKKILLLMGIFSFGISYAQVGINTQNPQGIFHIDTKSNTSGSSNISDDILVDSNGNLGIGTLTPKAKVDVNGSLSITNSGEADKYILTSDNIGIGTWKENSVTKVNRMSICKASGTFLTMNTTILPCQAPFTFTNNELGLTATPDGKIQIVPGLYLVIVDFDFTGVNEYGQIMAMRSSTNDYFMSNIYWGKLVGQSVSLLVTSTEEIWMTAVAKKYVVETDPAKVISFFDIPPFYNVGYNIEIRIIQIQ
ncbi:hypothetical protein [Dysgonomonas macrotermitis]|nr:hypothetical protein [Dysgonomonas macrotermitis]